MATEAERPKGLLLRIDSSAENAALLTLAVKGICFNVIKEDESSGQMQSCVSEAVHHAVDANGGLPGAGVLIAVKLFGDRVVFEISDAGRPAAAVDPAEPDIDGDKSSPPPGSSPDLVAAGLTPDQPDRLSRNGGSTVVFTKVLQLPRG